MPPSGQASVEYLGLVALVVAVVVAVGAVAGGEAIAGSFARQFERALCIVRGGDCEEDRTPCTVAGTTDSVDEHVTVGLLRIGRRKVVLIERRSDGTVAVTVVREHHVGAEIGLGAGAWLTDDGVDHAYGRVLRAAALAEIGDAATYVFDDAAAADSGLATLSGGHEPAGGHRVERVRSTGVGVAVDAAAKQGFGSLRADLVDATLTDEATGRTTLVLRAAAAAEALVAVDGRSAAGRAAGDERVAVTLDPDGRPLDLSVVRTGELGGSASVPLWPRRRAPPGIPTVSLAGHRRWVVEQHLDLTDPANLVAARDYVAAVRAGRDLPLPPPRVAGALRRRIAEAGLTDTRTYVVDASSSGLGAQVARGVGIGAAYGERVEHTRLVDASQRGADGVWRRRSDCLAAGTPPG